MIALALFALAAITSIVPDKNNAPTTRKCRPSSVLYGLYFDQAEHTQMVWKCLRRLFCRPITIKSWQEYCRVQRE